MPRVGLCGLLALALLVPAAPAWAASGTTTTIVSSANPAVYGQPVTFTATVSSSSSTPTGSVQFVVDGSDDGSPVALTHASSTSAVASFTTSTLAAAATAHTVVADYTGNSSFSPSNISIQQTVDSATTIMSLSTSVNPSVFGQPVTFTATVAANLPSSALPTGTVSFTIDGGPAMPVTLVGGQASLTTSTLAAGGPPHAVAAQYTGSSDFIGSGSSFQQTVNIAATNTTLTTSANPSVFGQPVTFTATVTANAPSSGTPTGIVNFLIDGSPAGMVALSGGQATFTTSALAVSGSAHLVIADYVGTSNFTGSESATVQQTVQIAGTDTSLSSSANPSLFGQPVTFTAAVVASAPSTATPAGMVSFTVDGAPAAPVALSGGKATYTASALALAGHTVSASYAGNASFAASSAPLASNPQVVAGAPSATIASPAGGQTYTVGQVVATTFSCSDGTGGAGLQSCTDSNGAASPGGKLATASAGTFIYTVTATSGDGLTASTSIAYTVVAPAPEVPEPTPLATAATPSLSSASESRSSWREGSALATFARARKPAIGTTFSFVLNEAAQVDLVFTRTVGGREGERSCVAQTKHNRHSRACSREVTAGTLSFKGHVGANQVAFQGRISATHRLTPGNYALLIYARAGSLTSAPAALSFTIVKSQTR